VSGRHRLVPQKRPALDFVLLGRIHTDSEIRVCYLIRLASHPFELSFHRLRKDIQAMLKSSRRQKDDGLTPSRVLGFDEFYVERERV
jgi:hypothetical protein